MNNFYALLIRHKLIVVIATLLVCIASFFGIGLVQTSFDIAAFMPEDANSSAGSLIEEDEFDSESAVYVLLEGQQNWQVLELKQRIEALGGVARVQWLDDAPGIYTPEAFLSQAALEQYKKGDATILIIGLSESENDAVAKIGALLGDGAYLGGQPVVLAEIKRLLAQEQALYLLIAGGILILILAASLRSYIAPLLCVLNILLAIALNYGTNFLVTSKVSFLTVAIAAILQMAVSMDYSIFLIHRFEEELTASDISCAMVSSMNATLTAISSSALTDCAGFAALVFMQNQIGADLGIVLSKGVLISLLLSMTFLPCMILATYPLGKRKHRVLMPTFERFAAPLTKYRFVLLALVVIALVPGIIGSRSQTYYYTTENFMPEDTAPIIATRKIGETFGTTDTVHVLYQKSMASGEPEAIAAIASIDGVRTVCALSDTAGVGIPEAFLPEALGDAYIGENYRRFTVTLERGLDNPSLFSAIRDVRAQANAHLGESYVTGAYASAADMASTAKWDNTAVELISIAFIFVILLIAYQSLMIPVFLVVVIKAAIFINVGMSHFIGEEMIFLTPVIVGAVQLGATVDYAILLTSRYVELRKTASTAKEAVTATIRAATRPMLTSVLTFFFATLSITLISSIKATREIAMVVGRGALISFVVILFALPALFVLFDKAMISTTLALRPAKNSPGRQSHDKTTAL